MLSGSGSGSGPGSASGYGGNGNINNNYVFTSVESSNVNSNNNNNIDGSSSSSGFSSSNNNNNSSLYNFEYFDERSYVSAGAIKPGEDAYGRNKFNQEASDALASDRAVPDTRGSACQKRGWEDREGRLPPTSVIITFHNEARSTLLRTIVR